MLGDLPVSFFLLNRAAPPPSRPPPSTPPTPCISFECSPCCRAVAELSSWDFTINLGIPCFPPELGFSSLRLSWFTLLFLWRTSSHNQGRKDLPFDPSVLKFHNNVPGHGPVFMHYAVSSEALSGNGRNSQYLSLLRNLLELFS